MSITNNTAVIAKKALTLASKEKAHVAKLAQTLKDYKSDILALKKGKITNRLQEDETFSYYYEKILNDEQFKANKVEAALLAFYCKIVKVVFRADPFKLGRLTHFIIQFFIEGVMHLISRKLTLNDINLVKKAVNYVKDAFSATITYVLSLASIYFEIYKLEIKFMYTLAINMTTAALITLFLNKGSKKTRFESLAMIVASITLAVIAFVKKRLFDAFRSGQLLAMRKFWIIIRILLTNIVYRVFKIIQQIAYMGRLV